MARDDRSREKGRVKFRFVEFELDGSDATLQESLRNIAAAILRGSSSNSLQARPAGKLAKQAAEEVTEEPEKEYGADAGTEFEPSDEVRGGVLRPQAPRKPPTPSILDLDLKSGETPLKAFLERLAPETTNDKYLAIVYWLKEYRQIPEVTMDHIFTAYRHMDWRAPKDVAQALRDMKSRNQWFNKGQVRGAYAINHVGEEQVLEMLRKKQQG